MLLKIQSFIKGLTISAFSFYSAFTMAADISEVPVFAIGGVDPNIMLVLDDSGSMRFESMLPTPNGQLLWDASKRRFEQNGKLLVTARSGFTYYYLYPSRDVSFRRIPFLTAFAFTRSADFNRSYYDNNINYKPWPTYGGYRLPNGNATFPNATPSAARLDPLKSATRNLTNTRTRDVFDLQLGMVCNNNGTVVTRGPGNSLRCGRTFLRNIIRNRDLHLGELAITYNPATYFRKVTGDEYTFRNRSGVEVTCTVNNLALPNTDNLYNYAAKNPGQVLTRSVQAIAPDGSCLKKVVIKSGESYPYTQTLPDGKTLNRTRTYREELQNFANWFTYHRDRNLSLRAGLAEGFQSQQTKDFNIGMFTINKNLRFDGMVPFQSNKAKFLKDVYSIPASGGTPLRSSLIDAGEIYARTGRNRVVKHSCQSNYTILFTDGYNTQTNISGVPRALANADKGKGEPYEDNAPGTLGDIAYYYYNNLHRRLAGVASLRGNDVKGSANCGTEQEKPWDDCNNKLHMTTYTFGLNAKGSLYDSDNPKRNSSEAAHRFATEFAWPESNINRRVDAQQIDDLWHAAVNGKGDIVNAKKTSDIEDGMTTILNDFLDGEATNAGVDVSDATVQADGANVRTIFKSKMNLATGAGDLEAYSLNKDGEESKTPLWSAEQQLAKRTKARRIITLGTQDKGVPFQWNQLKESQRRDLRTAPDGKLDATAIGQARLNFIAGDRSQEGELGDFRSRSALLGDMASSTPIFNGMPDLAISDLDPFGAPDKRYSDFKKAKEKRKGAVFVGANDGMLHAFDAANGNELFSYIPGLVYSTQAKKGLHYLTDKNYEKISYVDLPSTIYDVFITTPADGTKRWRSVLAGGLRTGGTGVFLLDVTNPHATAAQQAGAAAEKLVIWEYVDSGMGIMLQKPFVTMMNNGKWAVVFSNGYSPAGNDEIEGRMYIVYLEKQGGEVKAISIPTGVNGGLSPATLADLDGNGTTDRIYAGDLSGNLWAFDVASGDDTDWDIANNKPLFSARSSGGKRQPITVAPSVAANPYVPATGDGKTPVLVGFGTGKYLAESDIKNTDAQSFYLVADGGTRTLARANLSRLNVSGGGTKRSVSGTPADFVANQGWFLDFPNDGERSFVQPDIFNGNISFFSSLPSSNPCVSGGKSWFNSLQLNGASVDESPYSNLTEFGSGDIASVEIGDIIIVSTQTPVFFEGGSGTRVLIGRGNNLDDFQAVAPLEADVNGQRTAWEELLNNR